MFEINQSCEIDAPIEHVFELLAPSRLGEWYRREDEMTVEALDETAAGLGQRLQLASQRERLTVEIDHYERPTRFGWRSVRGRESTLLFFLLPLGSSTQVQAVETFAPRNLLGRVFKSSVRKIMTGALAEDLEALKELAERENAPEHEGENSSEHPSPPWNMEP